MVDPLPLTYALAAGVYTFFSPCSVGLLPGYVGYFLGTQAREGGGGTAASLLRGTRLGLVAASGPFVLFLAVAGLVRLIPVGAIGPALPYVSIGIGAGIVALGVLSLAGRPITVRLPQLPAHRVTASIFLFGVAYAAASLGCTFPVFLSVVFGAFATGSAVTGALAIVTFAAGMAALMVAVTIALAVSRDTTHRFLQRVTPYVTKASGVLMILAGAYVIYWWWSQLEAVRQITG